MSMKSDKTKRKKRKPKRELHSRCLNSSDQQAPWKRQTFLERMITKEGKK